MEKTKISKKALRHQINDSMLNALESSELSQPTKKVKKILSRTSKKLAAILADKLKRDQKRKKKAEKFMEDNVKARAKKSKKAGGVEVGEIKV